MKKMADTEGARDHDTWQWGTRLPDGREIPVSSEDEARAIRSGTPIRRKIGPWEEVG